MVKYIKEMDHLRLTDDCIKNSLLSNKPIAEGVRYILDVIIGLTKSDIGFVAKVNSRSELCIIACNDSTVPVGNFMEYNDFPDSLGSLKAEIVSMFISPMANSHRGRGRGRGHSNDNHVHQLIHGTKLIGILCLSSTVNVKDISTFVSLIKGCITNDMKLEKMEKQKSTFLANITHEIKNPLNGISCLSKLLSKTELSERQREHLDVLSQCNVQLLQIVRDLLDYSKINNGKMIFEYHPVNLKKCIVNSIKMVQSRATEKDLPIELNYSDKLPTLIISDDGKLCQVLMNILSNSIKFTKTGSITVNVTMNESQVLFEIIDTGIGIAKDKIAHSFDVFQQIENDYISSGTGVGLGLAISKYIVSELGGSIVLESEIGKGTTVKFSIEKKEFVNSIDIQVLKDYYKGKNILMIDYGTPDRDLAFSYLVELGCMPIVSSSTDNAVLYLKTDVFSFEFILINTCKPFTVEDLNKIISFKNSTVKIIIYDPSDTDLSSSSTTCDFKIISPVTKENFMKTLSLIYYDKNYKRSQIESKIKLSPAPSSIPILIPTPSPSTSISVVKKKHIIPKILVAEDNVPNQIVMIRLLESLNLNDVTVVSDGHEMISKAEEERYDVIFVDLKMPVLDGFSAVEALKKKKINSIIIAVTASISETVKNKCFEVGMDGYITKPIDFDEMKSVMNTIVHHLNP